jgi:hypothetical protein
MFSLSRRNIDLATCSDNAGRVGQAVRYAISQMPAFLAARDRFGAA